MCIDNANNVAGIFFFAAYIFFLASFFFKSYRHRSIVRNQILFNLSLIALLLAGLAYWFPIFFIIGTFTCIYYSLLLRKKGIKKNVTNIVVAIVFIILIFITSNLGVLC